MRTAADESFENHLSVITTAKFDRNAHVDASCARISADL